MKEKNFELVPLCRFICTSCRFGSFASSRFGIEPRGKHGWCVKRHAPTLGPGAKCDKFKPEPAASENNGKYYNSEVYD